MVPFCRDKILTRPAGTLRLLRFVTSLNEQYFKLRGEQTYNLRKLSQFYRPKVNSVYNGTERVSFLGPIIWNFVPNELKDIGNLAAFKKAIKK